jgi:hypothetical protein
MRKPALRWKKNPYPTGLARICCGHPGHSLRMGEDQYASVYKHNSRLNQKAGWYWVARHDPEVPIRNVCHLEIATEQEAKAQAAEYVKKCLAKAKEQA